MRLWQSRQNAETAADRLRVCGQPQRLMILSLLLDGERSVADIDAATEIGQPALSQQLAALRSAGLVSTRRQAKQVFYSLAGAASERLVRDLELAFSDGRGAAKREEQRAPPKCPTEKGAANFARIRARSGTA